MSASTARTSASSGKPLLTGTIEALPKRGITLDTCKRFGYMVSEDRRYQVAPYRANGVVVAQHLRDRKKNMPWRGDVKNQDLELFGEHTLKGGGKIVVITEGEIDALSVSQAGGNRWATCSIGHGAQGAAKEVTRRLKALLPFKKIVLMLDSDDPGREAAQEAAQALPAGKAYIATIPGFKDANEALVAGREDAIVKAIWEAAPWRPDGMVKAVDIRERIMSKPEMGLGWFDPRLDNLTYGRHPEKGQVWLIGAGVGVGKTAWLIRQLHHDLMVLKERVGGFFLETDTAELFQRIAAVELHEPFHLPIADDSDQPDRDSMWRTIMEFDDRFDAYDSFGIADLETLLSHMRYLAAGGTKVFYIDNLTQLTDESRMRESVEEAIREIKDFAIERKVIVMVASHLATPATGSHEEGATVSLRQFYGSRKLAAWIDGAVGLERDTVNEDPTVKRTTVLRTLKIRMNGSAVGERVGYVYDQDMDAVVMDDNAVSRFDNRDGEQPGDFGAPDENDEF